MSESKKQPEPVHYAANVGDLKIRISEAASSGQYANLAMINHSADEFMVDFIFVQPGGKQGEVESRVILSPGHYKRLLSAMQQNLQRYEKMFGTIPDRTPQMPQPSGPVN